MKGDLCQKCHYVGYYSFYRVYSFITSGIIRFIGYTRSLRWVLFVLSGIFVHYVGYYSFYRVYSFITSGIIRLSGIITSGIIMSGIITSGIITSGIITSVIEPAVRLPRCLKIKDIKDTKLISFARSRLMSCKLAPGD